MNSALPDGLVGSWVLVPFDVGDLGECVVPNDRAIALIATQQWTRLSFALDEIVLNRDRFEIAGGVEAE